MPTRLPTPLRSSSLALIVALLAACSAQEGSPSAGARKAVAGPPALTVNGESIAQPVLEAFAQMRGLDLSNPQQHERAARQLADLVLVDQYVTKQELGNDPSFAALVEVGRLQAVSASTLRHLQATLAVDDKSVREEYERQVAKSSGMTYSFSQMLYADEASARKALKTVQARPFDLTLNNYRQDARSARSFSNLRAAQLSPEIAKAIDSLKPGETLKEPVQLPQGWAILHLSSSGAVQPPAFEQLEEAIRRQLTRRAADEKLATLRDGATIVVANAPSTSEAQSAPAGADSSPPLARSAGE